MSKSKSKIKIAIVEDQRLFRDGLLSLIKEDGGYDIVATAENGRDFLNQLEQSASLPHVALVDMNMPEMNGFELIEIMQKKYPAIKVIILTVYNQERFIIKMIEAGVAGYLVKNCEIEEVLQAINAAHKSGFYFNEATMMAMRNSHQSKSNRSASNQIRSFANIPVELTERETEVLRLICREYTNPEIAEILNLSARTVDGHRTNLLAKTGSKNTAGLVLFAVNNGLYDNISFS